MLDLSKYDEIIIWGACFPPDGMGGGSPGYAIEKLSRLLKENGFWDKVLCVVDSNDRLHGKTRLGCVVKGANIILEHPDALVIINTISFRAVQRVMKSMGIKNDQLIIPYYFHHGRLGHPYRNEVAKKDAEKNGTKIRDLYYLEDVQTKRYLDIILSLRKKATDDLYTAGFYEGTGESQDYFCDPSLSPKCKVTYIDVGAYDGDSIEPVRKFYGNRLECCIAFEPDENLRSLLKVYLKKHHLMERTKIFSCALGKEDKEVKFINAGSMGQVSENGDTILEQRMFDRLSDIEIIGDAMVKMDIEGMEMEALTGMQDFIKNFQPYLAICVYHREQDLYEIADYIKSLNPGYRLYLRGGWHIECWAVPKRHYKEAYQE